MFANKLLVLLDGRTIYTPLFSGVFWEETDTVLEDVDHIEVIRGPGATLWGANAVNGVINIITKSAKETQGLLISGGGGIEERGFGTVRYDGPLASNVYYRVYGKYSDRDESTQVDGKGAEDSWWMSQGGFRLDWAASQANSLTLQGDYYYGRLGSKFVLHSLTPPSLFLDIFRSKVEGGSLLGRWAHEFSAESEVSVQMFYDRTDRGYSPGREIRDTVDLDAQHRFHLGERQEILWGGGYRFSKDDITPTDDFQMRDPSVELQLVSAFVQDEITLVPDRFHVTLGTKVEHNDFTGFEVQPSGRVAWTPHGRHTIWSAVSRAVRTPSRAERGFGTFVETQALLPPLPIPVLAPGMGNPNFGAEELLAYEIGYRVQIHPRLSLDWTAFYNDYSHLQAATVLPAELRTSPDPSSTSYLYLPLTFSNDLFGETYGVEASATWQPLDVWRLRGNYMSIGMFRWIERFMRRLLCDFEFDIDLAMTEASHWVHRLSMNLLWSAPVLWRFLDAARTEGAPPKAAQGRRTPQGSGSARRKMLLDPYSLFPQINERRSCRTALDESAWAVTCRLLGYDHSVMYKLLPKVSRYSCLLHLCGPRVAGTTIALFMPS